MTTEINIPSEAVEAAGKAIWYDGSGFDVPPEYIRYAIAAALNAWPMAHIHEWQRPWMGGMSGADIILPLPEAERIAKQEESDHD